MSTNVLMLAHSVSALALTRCACETPTHAKWQLGPGLVKPSVKVPVSVICTDLVSDLISKNWES